VLNDAEALKEQCPLYWRVLLRDALGLQVDKLRFDTNFDDATKAEPDCESYYYRRAIYLLPQWNGSNGEWHSDLTKVANRVGGESGDMLYAQVVWNIHQRYDITPFWEDDNSWTRVDRGFEVIEKHFPDSLAAKIERAQLAILANDAQAAAYLNSGVSKHGNGDLAGAISDYSKAIEVKPNYAKAYNNRGNVKHAQGDLDGAIADYTKAIEIKTNYFLAFYSRATTKQSKGDLVGAMADFNKVIEIQPDYADGYAGRAGLRQANRDYDGAMADFTRAIDLKPDFIQSLYIARGNLKQYKGDQSGAKVDFDLAARSAKATR
jgi:tetratricopeptide (TPR) repeat protein